MEEKCQIYRFLKGFQKSSIILVFLQQHTQGLLQHEYLPNRPLELDQFLRDQLPEVPRD